MHKNQLRFRIMKFAIHLFMDLSESSEVSNLRTFKRERDTVFVINPHVELDISLANEP